MRLATTNRCEFVCKKIVASSSPFLLRPGEQNGTEPWRPRLALTAQANDDRSLVTPSLPAASLHAGPTRAPSPPQRTCTPTATRPPPNPQNIPSSLRRQETHRRCGSLARVFHNSTRDISTTPLPLLLARTASACGQVARIPGGPRRNHPESACHLTGSSPAPALSTLIAGRLAAQYVGSTSIRSL
jgi:hypothetical protein